MANDLLSQITSAQLRRALAIREEIEKLQGELNSMVIGGSASPPPAAKKTTRKYTKKKGASSEADSEETTPKKAGKKGRELSPESRAKMAEAMRRRWAVKKGTAMAKPATKKAASKKAATKKSATKKSATKKSATKKAAAKKASATGGATKRELSPESRAKMAEAMRRRWAVKKGNR